MNVRTFNEVTKALSSGGIFPGRVNIRVDSLATHLQAIARRALEINDQEIISKLVLLGVINETKGEPTIADKE